LLGLRQPLNVIGRVSERPEARDRIFECGGPTQWRQPSLSTSISKPSGMRGSSPSSGMLHHGQGMPAAPQLQAWGPSHGRPAWGSQTQPQSWQRVHLIIGIVYPLCQRQPAISFLFCACCGSVLTGVRVLACFNPLWPNLNLAVACFALAGSIPARGRRMKILRYSIEHLAAPICDACNVEMAWSSGSSQ
jgi:hypothetical protein